jgi:hypothetical protein
MLFNRTSMNNRYQESHVRRLPTILLGAFILPIGLLPMAAHADTVPDTTASATVSPEPTPTVSPVPSATVAPVPSASAEPTAVPTSEPTPTETDPGDPGDPGEETLTGKFGMKPAYGPAGTVVKVKSKTDCVDGGGAVGPHVEFLMGDEESLKNDDGELIIDKVLSTDSDGAWATKAKIPSSAKPGEIYGLIAACFDADTEPSQDAEPFLVYDVQIFKVTEADKAPVADPVPGDPNYTG